jgi:hypothetical protein
MIDLNFYPEQHMNDLVGLTDVEVPQGWTLGQLIRVAHDAKLDLWAALNEVDDDGNIRARWK